MSNFVLLLTSGALTAFPVDFYIIVFAKFFAGIAHGITYVTVISHLSDNCTKFSRGFQASFNFFCLQIGLIASLPSIIAHVNLNLAVHPWRINGGLSCFLSLIAIISTLKFTKESVIDLIRKGQNVKALRTLQELRGEKFETTMIRDDFDEIKVMLIEDKFVESNSIFLDSNMRPLLTLLLLKISLVLSFNYSLNLIRLNVDFASDWKLIWMLLPRIFIGIFITISIEQGRRMHFISSAICVSLTLITLGILKFLQVQYNVIDLLIFIAFEIAAAIGLGACSHVYDAEAFRSIKKAKSVAFLSVFEHILQIAFIFLAVLYLNKNNDIKTLNMNYSDEIFIMSSAVAIILITIYMLKPQRLPETKCVSIRRSRTMFLST